MVYYPTRGASGFLHGMLLQQPKKKGGVTVLSFTGKWRFIMINVRTGELHVYKIPSSQKINSNNRQVTDVTSYCPNHDFQFQQCGDLHLIVRTTNWTLQDSNRGGDGASFTLRWDEQDNKQEPRQEQGEEEMAAVAAATAGDDADSSSSSEEEEETEPGMVSPSQSRESENNSNQEPETCASSSPAKSKGWLRKRMLLKSYYSPKLKSKGRGNSSDANDNVANLASSPDCYYALSDEEEPSQSPPLSNSDDVVPPCKTESELLTSFKRSHSESSIIHGKQQGESDSPLLSKTQHDTGGARNKINLDRTVSDDTDDNSIGADTSDQTLITSAGTTAAAAVSTKTRSLCLKCPYGGNEKAVYIKAAAELGCLIVKPSKRRSAGELADGLGHATSASGSGAGVRKKVWRYRQRGQQPLDFQAMSIAIGTSRHGYSNTLNTNRRRAGSTDAPVESERVKEFLVMPAYAYPVRWMTQRELQSEVEHKSTVFHSVAKHPECSSLVPDNDACRLPSRDSVSSVASALSPTTTSRNKHLNESLDNTNKRDTGVIGWMEVEVLSCIGLPHADVLSKTDAMAYLVCGSHVFQTDTIFNTNSPMWPRKSKRAVRFPLTHAYARLYCGVFDNLHQRRQHETRVLAPHSATRTHGGQGGMFAGRVSLDVAALRPNSLYDVTLPLRYTTQMHAIDPRPRGAIRLRCRLHWDNERCAVLSYLPPRMRSPSAAIEEGANTTATIPCDDRNMFRCVALKVHGTDMNGRFSLPMFKETMTEVKLFRSYFTTLAKETTKQLHEWTNPVMSCYVFGGWMHCVYRNSVALVYPYVMGYLILCMLENYARFVVHKSFYAGFSPLTLQELFRALVSNTSLEKRHMKPWGRSKKEEAASKQQHKPRRLSNMLSSALTSASRSGPSVTTTISAPSPYQPRAQSAAEMILEPLGFLEGMPRYEASSFVSDMKHQDFPASDPAKHPKREVRHSAASGVVGGGHHGVDIDFGEGSMDYYGDSNNPYNSDSDSSIDDGSTRGASQRSTKKKKKQRLYHNVDKAREGFQSKTGHLFEDRVFMVPDATRNSLRKRRTKRRRKAGHEAPEETSDAQFRNAKMDAQAAKQARKQMEFILEMKAYRNPIMVKVEKYGRPLMMLIRVSMQVVRASINLFTWRDPYLSFWFLLFLIAMTFVLMVFPWRLFMLASGVGAVGPQNIYLMNRKKKRKATEKANVLNASEHGALNEKESLLSASHNSERSAKCQESNAQEHVTCSETDEATGEAPPAKTTTTTDEDNNQLPAEKSQTKKSSSGKKSSAASGTAHATSQKMEVVVPYSQVKLDRFFDWPPDPAVSFVVSEEANTRRKRTSMLNATRLRAQLGSKAALLGSSSRNISQGKTNGQQ